MRKQLIAIATGLALGAAGLATPALAAHGGGGHASGGGGHFSAGGGGRASFGGARGFVAPQARSFATPQANAAINHTVVPNASPGVRGNFAANNYGHPGNWNHGRWGRGYGYGGGVYAFGGYGPYYDYGPDYYDYSDNGCLQQEYVPTPFGMQLQWVDVCQ
jgi:hypothetical protein